MATDSYADYKENYETYWKEIIENPDGTLNKDAIMRELCDFSMVMDYAGKVYCHVTGSMISKLNTLPDTVINIADEHYESIYNEDNEKIIEGLNLARQEVEIARKKAINDNSDEFYGFHFAVALIDRLLINLINQYQDKK